MSSWNTIESDAGVFTELVEKFGVKNVEFQELLDISPESLAEIAPLYGVVFLFKYRASQYKQTASHGPQHGTYSDDPTVFFAQQTIQNACATQAVLNVLLNRSDVELGETLTGFKQFTESFDPELRGESITNSDQIREVHNSFSRPTPFVSDSDRPDRDEDDDGLYHFIGYVPVNGVLYELDGLHARPIAHGPCTDEQFPAKVSAVLQERLTRGPEGELRFSLIGITNDKREFYRQIGDHASLQREEAKRQEWTRENALRRENFVGMIYELTKAAVASMSDEEFESAIAAGRDATKRRYEQRVKGQQ